MQKSAREWFRRIALVALATTTILTSGCGGGGGDGGSGGVASASGSGATGGNAPPTISGNPLAQANVGAAYGLAPSAQDADGDTLAFSIENRPHWATFNTATGELSGTPAVGDVGTAADIVISVSDGKSRAALPAFSIEVVAAASGETAAGGTRSVALSWDVPTQTVSGENLVDLAGYRIHYGTSADKLSEAVEIQSSGMNTFTISDLKPGTYYFAVRAIASNGVESTLSNVISRRVS